MHARILLVVAVFTGLLQCAAHAAAVTPVESWQGSAENGESAAKVPQAIFDAKAFAAAWKLCERTDPVPEIDFTKHVAVIETTTGGRLQLRVTLNDKGDLLGAGIATRDIRPGFRYVIAVCPKEGVRTVNGVPVPEAK